MGKNMCGLTAPGFALFMFYRSHKRPQLFERCSDAICGRQAMLLVLQWLATPHDTSRRDKRSLQERLDVINAVPAYSLASNISVLIQNATKGKKGLCHRSKEIVKRHTGQARLSLALIIRHMNVITTRRSTARDAAVLSFKCCKCNTKGI